MFRSLRMKLVLIMLLLIAALMTVTGFFMTNSVSGFYMNQFYEQMDEMFGQNESFVADLRSAAAAGSVELMRDVLEKNAGGLGVDIRTRNYYILDGETGSFLTGSDERSGRRLTATLNLVTALNGKVGSQGDLTASYMDVAMPIEGGGNSYIVYILDNRETVQELSDEVLMLVIEALIFGLVIAVLLSFLLSKTLIAPIERLKTGAERVASGDFSDRLEVPSQDEIGVLTGTFNNMAEVLETTLREIENERNKLDTLFLHMTDGVVAFARDGLVMHSNPAAAEMLGRPIGGQDHYEEVFGPEAPPFGRLLVMKQPSFLEAEQQLEGRSLKLYLAPFSGEDSGGVLVLIHDVTEQRRIEEMRREFVANVSHELRTPLTNVRSYAETLAEAEDLPPEMQKNFLGVIVGETDRMTHIVQDLLTLSRFDYGKMELNMTRFPFADAIDNVYRSLELEARRLEHTMTREYPADLPEIRADRVRLEQVILNVLANAVKYTPAGGEIHVSAGAGDGSVWVEVRDNGIGIPAESRDRIFERFYRVDKARSRESGGTGLGLSIAKEIVEKHQGRIQLMDREGPGTSIRITLPIEGGEGHEEA